MLPGKMVRSSYSVFTTCKLSNRLSASNIHRRGRRIWSLFLVTYPPLSQALQPGGELTALHPGGELTDLHLMLGPAVRAEVGWGEVTLWSVQPKAHVTTEWKFPKGEAGQTHNMVYDHDTWSNSESNHAELLHLWNLKLRSLEVLIIPDLSYSQIAVLWVSLVLIFSPY